MKPFEQDPETPGVVGLGGILFKCKDPEATRQWYHKHLGVAVGPYGAMFQWYKAQGQSNQEAANTPENQPAEHATPGFTAWSPMEESTDYLGAESQQFMINYRVQHLARLLEQLKSNGVTIIGEPQTFEYGTFAWIEDLDGRRIELWEPIDSVFDQMPAERMLSR